MFSKSQFTTTAQNVFCLIETCTDTSNHGLSHSFKRPELVAKDSTSIKNALVACVFISNWTWIHKSFWVSPQIKIQRIDVHNTNWMGQHIDGLHLEKCLQMFTHANCFRFGVGNSILKLPKHCRQPGSTFSLSHAHLCVCVHTRARAHTHTHTHTHSFGNYIEQTFHFYLVSCPVWRPLTDLF